MFSPILWTLPRAARALSALTLITAAALGCSRSRSEPHPQVQPQAVTPATQPQAAPAAAAAETAGTEVVWDVPANWTAMPARAMRKATYEAAGQAGPAEIGVFYFGPDQGGGVDANIQRWVGQFSDVPADGVKQTAEDLNGMKRINVEIAQGTFSSGMPGAPASSKTNWAMSASIVQTPHGQYYFKMTGPAASVAEQKTHFRELLSSLRIEKTK